MKLIIREYLSSLKERGELDVILPDLLLELGMHVYSRPSIGTRQYGVDVAAVGSLGRGQPKSVHLLSIKGGDLDRQTWNGNANQVLRPSLDEIIDAYISNSIPSEYKELPVVIWICVGGEIKEAVRQEVSGYCTRNSTDKIEIQEWDGGRLTELFLKGLMSDKILDNDNRRLFRKSVALVDEPATSAMHFRELLINLTENHSDKTREKLRTLRLINLLLRILIGWGRITNNYEAPYICSEASLLLSWQHANIHLGKQSKISSNIGYALSQLSESYLIVGEEYFKSKILPFTDVLHGLSSAVPSSNSLDINLKIFDLLGRVSLFTLWIEHISARIEEKTRYELLLNEMDKYRTAIMQMIDNNPVLVAPVSDLQSIPISLTVMALTRDSRYIQFIQDWVKQIFMCCQYQHMAHLDYPSMYTDYRSLVHHPKERNDAYRDKATASSVLYPTLGLWMVCLNDLTAFSLLSDFAENKLQHSSFQFWMPGEDSESAIYSSSHNHGWALISKSNLPTFVASKPLPLTSPFGIILKTFTPASL